MTRDVVTVPSELPLVELMELFMSRHITGAPVVSGQHVVGVVSATDLLSFAVATAGRPIATTPALDEDTDSFLEDPDPVSDDSDEDIPAAYYDSFRQSGAGEPPEWEEFSSDGRRSLYEYTVADVMSRDVRSLPPDTDLALAAGFMTRAGVHRLLVMTDGRLEGIVSSMDIVQAVARGQLPTVEVVLAHDADFDATWAREPVVRDD